MRSRLAVSVPVELALGDTDCVDVIVSENESVMCRECVFVRVAEWVPRTVHVGVALGAVLVPN